MRAAIIAIGRICASGRRGTGITASFKYTYTMYQADTLFSHYCGFGALPFIFTNVLTYLLTYLYLYLFTVLVIL